MGKEKDKERIGKEIAEQNMRAYDKWSSQLSIHTRAITCLGQRCVSPQNHSNQNTHIRACFHSLTCNLEYNISIVNKHNKFNSSLP